jgi:hypothetical protein
LRARVNGGQASAAGGPESGRAAHPVPIRAHPV